MSTTHVVRIEAARERSRRLARTAEARRRLAGGDGDPEDGPERKRSGGRLWVNGGELGGARAALAHLAHCYD